MCGGLLLRSPQFKNSFQRSIPNLGLLQCLKGTFQRLNNCEHKRYRVHSIGPREESHRRWVQI